jgi:hypothetical protein
MDYGYGRVQFSIVKKLNTFAALRLYFVGCVSRHTHAEAGRFRWDPAEMATFLGVPGARIDNLKDRVIPAAISAIKAAYSLPFDDTHVIYGRDAGRGRAISMVLFAFHGSPWEKQRT